jgi:hypothetical protein
MVAVISIWQLSFLKSMEMYRTIFLCTFKVY